MPQNNLPEGTDSIIDGAGGSSSNTSGGTGLGGSSGSFGTAGDYGTSGVGGASMGSGMSSGIGSTAMTDTSGSTAGISGQAADKARQVASQGKDKATEALGSMSQMINEAADMVDEKLGPQYGNYARRAGEAVDSFSDSLRNKEVDELVDDARSLVRKSPAVAIGIAAGVGFLLVRLLKSGMPNKMSAYDTDYDDDFTAGGTRDTYASGARFGGTAGTTGTPPRVDTGYDPVA